MPTTTGKKKSAVGLAKAVRTETGDSRVSVSALDSTPLGIALTQKKLEDAERCGAVNTYSI